MPFARRTLAELAASLKQLAIYYLQFELSWVAKVVFAGLLCGMKGAERCAERLRAYVETVHKGRREKDECGGVPAPALAVRRWEFLCGPAVWKGVVVRSE